MGLMADKANSDSSEVLQTRCSILLGDSIVGFPQSIHSGSLPDCHDVGGCNGLFWRVTHREPVSFASVTDGLSNTLMIGEDVPSQNHHSAAFYANGDWFAMSHSPKKTVATANVMTVRQAA